VAGLDFYVVLLVLGVVGIAAGLLRRSDPGETDE
jgi:hypothetical protein